MVLSPPNVSNLFTFVDDWPGLFRKSDENKSFYELCRGGKEIKSPKHLEVDKHD